MKRIVTGLGCLLFFLKGGFLGSAIIIGVLSRDYLCEPCSVGQKNPLYFHRRDVWQKACHMSRCLLTNHMRCFCWCGSRDRSITLQHPLLKQRTKPWRPSPFTPRCALARDMSRILSASHLPVSCSLPPRTASLNVISDPSNQDPWRRETACPDENNYPWFFATRFPKICQRQI